MVKNGIARCFLEHQQAIYTKEYYLKDVESAAVSSSDAICSTICRVFRPSRVIDVGCGTGALLAAFARRQVEILGLEYSEAGRELARQKGVPTVAFDLRRCAASPSNRFGGFDVATCMEVAEHVPGSFADELVGLLTRLAPVVVFTAAPPNSGGTDHVNEQPREYWIAKFGQRRFEYQTELVHQWRTEWQRLPVAGWYCSNLFIFTRATRANH